MNIIASGWRGTISVEEHSGKKIATKAANDDSVKAAINKESGLLVLLNTAGVNFVPQIHQINDGSFSYERIEGIHFRDWWKSDHNKNERRGVAQQLLDHAYTLDKLGIIHGELIRPLTNVLVNKENKVFIIDFERGKQGDFSGRNMKNVSQWMHRVGYIDLETVKQLGTMQQKEIYNTLQKHIIPQELSPSFRIGICLLLGGDLITKWLFYNKEFLSEFILITPLLNTGIGRSIPVPQGVVMIFTLVAIGLLLYGLKKKEYGSLSVLLLLPGALGNAYDRIVYSGVRDFIDLQYRPVFNGADILITLGAFFIIKDILFQGK